MGLLRRLFDSQDGATSAEYALILAIVGAAIIVAAVGLSGAIANEMNEASSDIGQ